MTFGSRARPTAPGGGDPEAETLEGDAPERELMQQRLKQHELRLCHQVVGAQLLTLVLTISVTYGQMISPL